MRRSSDLPPIVTLKIPPKPMAWRAEVRDDIRDITQPERFALLALSNPPLMFRWERNMMTDDVMEALAAKGLAVRSGHHWIATAEGAETILKISTHELIASALPNAEE